MKSDQENMTSEQYIQLWGGVTVIGMVSLVLAVTGGLLPAIVFMLVIIPMRYQWPCKRSSRITLYIGVFLVAFVIAVMVSDTAYDIGLFTR
jgi:multisubunit Na+/H+ antiporter MnhB subunit